MRAKKIKTKTRKERNKKMSSRRVMYLRDKDYRPIGCVAISMNKSKTQVRYQVSVLNPIDKFERSLSRHIALGRLLEKPFRLNGFTGAQTKFDITETVMRDILNSKDVPNRARKAAKIWLKYNPRLDEVPASKPTSKLTFESFCNDIQ